jgi:hypothetical protein
MVMVTRQRSMFVLIGLAISLFVLSLAPASAASANISRAYYSTQPITTGSLLSLDTTKSEYVRPANINNGTRLLGIAVVSSDSLLAVNAGVGTVQVATSGVATALVSDFNGNIQVGDQVTVSPFDGIGMKATNASKIIGLAQSTFRASSTASQHRTITDTAGKRRQIAVGSIRVSIDLGLSTATNGQNLTGIQKVLRSLTGKVIPTSRIIVAIAITAISLIALIALIYGSVYSSIISVGRNPLAKYAIYRSMATVLLMAAMLATVTIIVVLLMLK